MPEMLCTGCNGAGQKQEYKVSVVTNPDGSQSSVSEPTMVQCTTCGGTGKQHY
ncbi:hypothetical protein ACFP3U_35470 [Kitasatospora misakiensis]|uniref:Molecular chaperone DnaJ n=1 Tax=Kitasatospora misakiensis TaxID=67330 RepID=A0ABW0XIE4_9ACTN